MNDDDDINYLKADGFDDAIVGLARPWQNNQQLVAVYDGPKCIEILMERDGMDADEAHEFFEFNVAGSFVGEQTPIFVFPLED